MNSDDIFKAVFEDDLARLSVLLEVFGTEVQDFFGDYVLVYAVIQEKSEAVRVLINHGADVGVKGYLGDALLHLAAKKGNLDIVRQLCEHGANIDELDQEGVTPLGYAVRFGYYDVARYLVGAGASVDIVDEITGLSPFDYALKKDGVDLRKVIKNE